MLVREVHNKGIIVDGSKTLVSSINWSENSPANNREMGVIIDDAAIADFYTDIFYYDWYTGAPVNWVTISEVMYDPIGTESAEEWVELYNPNYGPAHGRACERTQTGEFFRFVEDSMEPARVMVTHTSERSLRS